MTTVARTLVDLAACLDATGLSSLVEEVLGGRRTTLRAIDDVMERLGGQGVPGVATLRQELKQWSPEAQFDSVAEARLFGLLATHLLPRPVTQHRIELHGRHVATVDFAWPHRRVALEMDGFRFHAGPQAFGYDRTRQNRLVAAGWTVYRTTPHELSVAPGELVVTLRQALRN